MGYVRFRRSGDKRAFVSIAIAQKYRGHGYGTVALKRGALRIFRLWPIHKVVGLVKVRNKASRFAFIKAGFQVVWNTRWAARKALVLEMEKR